MTRSVLWILLLFSLQALGLAAGCCGRTLIASYPSGGHARTPEQQAAAAVDVTSVCMSPSGTSIHGGSGVIVSELLVLTASHVIKCDGERGIHVETAAEERAAVVRAIDVQGDVALLLLDKPVALPRALVGPRPHVDERVCLVSAVPGRTRHCGTVERHEALPGDVRHSAITEPGNSGSGVYDTRGRLVGVVTHFVKCTTNGQICGGLFTSLESRRLVIQ